MSELQLTRTECGLPDSVGLCSLSQEKLPGQPEPRILGHFHRRSGLRRSATSWSLGTSRCPLTGRCPLASQSQPLPLSTLEKMNMVKPKHRTHVYDVWISSRKACRALEASASSVRTIFMGDHVAPICNVNTWEGKEEGSGAQGKSQLHSKFKTSLGIHVTISKNKQGGPYSPGSKSAFCQAKQCEFDSWDSVVEAELGRRTHTNSRPRPSPVSGSLCVPEEGTSGFLVVAPQERVRPGRVAAVVPLVRSSPEVGSQVQEG